MLQKVGESEAVVERVAGFIDRAINHLKKHVVEGRLLPGDQYAIRVLESRKRLLVNLFDAGNSNDPGVKRVAREALRFMDVGQLIKLGEKLHSKGRLDCRACDGVTDGTSLRGASAMPVCGAVPCTSCEKGVQHLYTTRVDLPDIGSGGVEVGTGDKTSLSTRHDEPQGVNSVVGRVQVTQQWVCEACGWGVVRNQRIDEIKEIAPVERIWNL